ncbi:MAG: ABC transporter ATP-binding protein/permease [Propionibacteriaceae bacterium]|jgi:ATP-binding cassette subfamily B protein|nr:ABC transporter ATP-binding protein/permease [Propionibacteriaceae bacterium]
MLRKLVFRFIRPYGGALLGVLLLQAMASMASLTLPTLNAAIIDDGVAKGDTAFIWTRGALMLAVSVAQVVGQVGAAFCGAKLAMGFGRDVRAGLFDHVLRFSAREVNKFGAPSLITRNTNDVQQVQQLLLMSCVFIASAPLTAGGGIVMALREDIGLSWLILAAVGALGVVIGIVVGFMTPLFRKNQERIDNINRVLREQLTGIRVIRAFIREPSERKRFRAANSDLMTLGFKIGTLFSLIFPAVNLILNLSTVGVMWFGGHRIDTGDLQIGQMQAFIQYLMQILMSVMMATMMLMMLPRAQVCARRIMEVFNTPSSVAEPEHPITEVATKGHIEFKNVTYHYPGAESPVLKDVSFAVEPGTVTAIVGATGSGKTTLVNLIPRLADATSGSVLVDGVDVRQLDQDVLWAHVGLVPQKPYLFSGTVASNLEYGKPDASADEMWTALRTAAAESFVRERGGLESGIAQGGTDVSGGQRQRLSIARALMKQPDVYVFDDAFSALDVATDAQVRSALAAETKAAAVLIVAQRITSIRDADQILVLDEGRIVGRGTHIELLADCPTYAEIVASQLSAEEATA